MKHRQASRRLGPDRQVEHSIFPIGGIIPELDRRVAAKLAEHRLFADDVDRSAGRIASV